MKSNKNKVRNGNGKQGGERGSKEQKSTMVRNERKTNPQGHFAEMRIRANGWIRGKNREGR